MKRRIPGGSKILKERSYYLPTCLTDDGGAISLFVRYFMLARTPKGRLRIHIKDDVLVFQCGAEMGAYICREHLRELPKEAEDDRHYLPRAFRKKEATIAC